MAALSLAVAGALAAGPPGGASPADAAPTAARLPVPETIAVPAGVFLAGSDVDERARAYALDASAYGHSRTREQGWYDGERALAEHVTGAYHVTRTPITNAQYAAFVAETGHRAPDVDARTWAGYGLVHPFERTRRHAWRGGRPPAGRERHPVVLVSRDDAMAYARWLTERTGGTWRLPTELEWE